MIQNITGELRHYKNCTQVCSFNSEEQEEKITKKILENSRLGLKSEIGGDTSISSTNGFTMYLTQVKGYLVKN